MDEAWLDATEQAARVRRGEVSPSELVAAAIDRIERIDPSINAVIHRRFEQATAEAAAPLPDGPFRGVPLVVKDLTIQTKGDPFHCGTRFLKNLGYRADHDTFVATKFRQAGFVIVGRTNTPEFGSTITTEPLSYGPSRNPWDTTRSTGGSSGGSAAAVAAGMVAVGHATDGGGSIRIPASECGLVGLKPTRARVSQGPDIGDSWMGATIDHAVTRSVRDSAAVLDAIHGPMPGDPYAAPTPARSFLAEVGADPGSLKIGWSVAPTTGGEVAPECIAAVHEAAQLLNGLGHHVQEGAPAAFADADYGHHFIRLVSADMAATLAFFEKQLGRTLGDEDVEPANLLLAEIGRSISAPDYVATVQWFHRFQRRMASWWAPDGDGFDVLLTPVIAIPPPPLGWLDGSNIRDVMQFTSQFNITGQPAVSLPLHWTASGLPVGVQLVAAFGREDVLLRVAAQAETARPWAGRHAPVG